MTPTNSRSLASLNTLVVEANPHWQKVLKTMLHSAGFRAITAVDEVDKRMGHLLKKADLVFIECHLGDGKSGFALVKKIRSMSDEEIAGTPIIMMSELTTRENIIAAIRAGCNEFLEKPIAPARLLDRVKLVIEHPRENIKLEGYFGPDRRRGIDSDYQNGERRQIGG